MSLPLYCRFKLSTISYSLIAFAYSSPIFFYPSLSIVRGEECADLGFSLPIGIIILALLCLRAIIPISASNKPAVTRHFLSAVFLFLPFLLLNISSPLLLFLYLLPILFSYVIVEVYVRDRDVFLLLLRRIALFLGVFSSLHVVSSVTLLGFFQAFALRGTCSIFNLFSIYQIYIYYPLLLSFAFAIIILDSSRFSPFTYTILTFIFLDIVLCSSRESFLISLFALVVKFISSRSSVKMPVITGMFLLPSICFYLFVPFGNGSELESSMLVQKLMDIDVRDPSSLTAGRLDVFSYIFNQFHITPTFFLFGSAFDDTFLARETPHNQYLEWFIRGGLPIVLLSVYAVFSALWRSFMLFRRDQAYLSTFTVLLACVFVSCLINTPFRAPFSSLFLWFLVFSVHKLYGRFYSCPAI